jgi:hypothetical protein
MTFFGREQLRFIFRLNDAFHPSRMEVTSKSFPANWKSYIYSHFVRTQSATSPQRNQSFTIE